MGDAPTRVRNLAHKRFAFIENVSSHPKWRWCRWCQRQTEVEFYSNSTRRENTLDKKSAINLCNHCLVALRGVRGRWTTTTIPFRFDSIGDIFNAWKRTSSTIVRGSLSLVLPSDHLCERSWPPWPPCALWQRFFARVVCNSRRSEFRCGQFHYWFIVRRRSAAPPSEASRRLFLPSLFFCCDIFPPPLWSIARQTQDPSPK